MLKTDLPAIIFGMFCQNRHSIRERTRRRRDRSQATQTDVQTDKLSYRHSHIESQSNSNFSNSSDHNMKEKYIKQSVTSLLQVRLFSNNDR